MNKEISKVILGVLGTLITAGIIASITMFLDIRERLARIETKLEIVERTNLAQK